MINEIIVISILGIIVGIILAYILSKTNIKFPTKDQRKKNKIINNPELLAEKLNENEIVDNGEKLEYSVVEKDGEKHLDLKKTPIKINPPTPKTKPKVKKSAKAKPNADAH